MTHMTKTWFEDGKLITQFIPQEKIYMTPEDEEFEALEKRLQAKKPVEVDTQEPVAWADHGVLNWIADMQFKHASYLYTHPQQKREPLTDEQILRLLSKIDECAVRLPRGLREFARAIEAAHGIKD